MGTMPWAAPPFTAGWSRFRLAAEMWLCASQQDAQPSSPMPSSAPSVTPWTRTEPSLLVSSPKSTASDWRLHTKLWEKPWRWRSTPVFGGPMSWMLPSGGNTCSCPGGFQGVSPPETPWTLAQSSHAAVAPNGWSSGAQSPCCPSLHRCHPHEIAPAPALFPWHCPFRFFSVCLTEEIHPWSSLPWHQRPHGMHWWWNQLHQTMGICTRHGSQSAKKAPPSSYSQWELLWTLRTCSGHCWPVPERLSCWSKFPLLSNHTWTLLFCMPSLFQSCWISCWLFAMLLPVLLKTFIKVLAGKFWFISVHLLYRKNRISHPHPNTRFPWNTSWVMHCCKEDTCLFTWCTCHTSSLGILMNSYCASQYNSINAEVPHAFSSIWSCGKITSSQRDNARPQFSAARVIFIPFQAWL